MNFGTSGVIDGNRVDEIKLPHWECTGRKIFDVGAHGDLKSYDGHGEIRNKKPTPNQLHQLPSPNKSAIVGQWTSNLRFTINRLSNQIVKLTSYGKSLQRISSPRPPCKTATIYNLLGALSRMDENHRVGKHQSSWIRHGFTPSSHPFAMMVLIHD